MIDDSPILEETGHGRSDGRGLMLVGVQRARSWRGRKGGRDGDGDVVSVRYRDLEALARPSQYELPDLHEELVLAHQRAVEAAMRRDTIIPAPFGIIFHGRRPLIRMLQDQYLIMDEALSFVEGQCEVRVHINTSDEHDADDELDAVASQIYSELRRMARAAIPFPTEGHRVFSAAFLVEKTAWVEFIERAEEAVGASADLVVDVTGPWPPYDFVRFTY